MRVKISRREDARTVRREEPDTDVAARQRAIHLILDVNRKTLVITDLGAHLAILQNRDATQVHRLLRRGWLQVFRAAEGVADGVELDHVRRWSNRHHATFIQEDRALA